MWIVSKGDDAEAEASRKLNSGEHFRHVTQQNHNDHRRVYRVVGHAARMGAMRNAFGVSV
jgi:hypothetical protein